MTIYKQYITLINMKHIHMNLSNEHWDWIKRYGNATEYIRRLIDRDMNMHEHKRLTLPSEPIDELIYVATDKEIVKAHKENKDNELQS